MRAILVVLAVAGGTLLVPAAGGRTTHPERPPALAAWDAGRPASVCAEGEYATRALATWSRALGDSGVPGLIASCVEPDVVLVAGSVPPSWQCAERATGCIATIDGVSHAYGPSVANLKHELGHALGLPDDYRVVEGDVVCRARWAGEARSWRLPPDRQWTGATVMDAVGCGGQGTGPYANDVARVLSAWREGE